MQGAKLMPRRFAVSGEILVDTDPATAYAHVSDPTRMGESSPENLGADVADDRGGAYVGMTFDGHNKRGPARWTTRCVVTAADPGQRFAFRVGAIGLKTPRVKAPIASWEYRFDEVDGKTRITETWTDDRRAWPDLAARAFDAMATGGKTFAEFQQGNIDRTLRRLKKVLEAG
jgi:hypothetical protein